MNRTNLSRPVCIRIHELRADGVQHLLFSFILFCNDMIIRSQSYNYYSATV